MSDCSGCDLAPPELLDDVSERRLLWLIRRTRELARGAKSARRRREADVVIIADERGRLAVRFRPEETPDG